MAANDVPPEIFQESLDLALEAILADIVAGGSDGDFGTAGLLTDLIKESSVGAGTAFKTLNHLKIKDGNRINVAGSAIASGDSGITGKANFANMFDVKDDAGQSFLRFVSTTGAKLSKFLAPCEVDDDGNGAVRVGGIYQINTTPSTAITGTTDAGNPVIFDQDVDVTAGKLNVAGRRWRVKAEFSMVGWDGNDALNLKLLFNNVEICAGGSHGPPAANGVITLEFEGTTITTGASGTVRGSGKLQEYQRAAAPTYRGLSTGSSNASPDSAAIDLTGTIAVRCSATWAAASDVSSSIRQLSIALELLN